MQNRGGSGALGGSAPQQSRASAFSRCGSISTAAKRARIDRRTHYNWLKEDPWYVEAYKQSVQQAGDALEDKLNELAHDGNVTAAIFLLKGLRPNKYRERSQVDVKYPKKIDDLPEELLDDFIEQFGPMR